MNLSETRKGEIYIYTAGVIWSLFPIVTQLSYVSIDPLLSLSWSVFFSCFFFASVITLRGKWRELLDLSIYKDILLATFFIGILFYTFFYLGLKHTSAGNASLIALMEVFFTYILFQVWVKEQISIKHTLGALFMIFGAAIIFIPQVKGFQPGDWLILLATICAPLGNYYQKRARKNVSSEVILFIRSLVTTPVVFLLAKILNPNIHFFQIRSALPLLLISGIILLGLTKILWVEAIHRVSVTKAIALSGIDPLFTLFFAYLILHQIPTVWQVSSFVPLTLGLVLLTLKD